MSPREIEICEWQRAAAGEGHPALVGLFLNDPELAAALSRASLSGRLHVSDSRQGLVIQAQQYVGVLQLGPLRIRILPKMSMIKMWIAVAYALGLDGLRHYDPVQIHMAGDFADLLALMLLREAERLWRAGVQRGYHPSDEWRTTPRGRPDLVTLARSGPLTRAALPCRYQEFTTDVIENQVILAGLELACGMSSGLALRGALAHASQRWSTVCRRTRLDRELLHEAEHARNRLNARYAGAHRLVRLLYERAGLDDPESTGGGTSPGFLWDMAALFERFVARFLTEHLPEHDVITQYPLRALYRVVWDRPGRRSPQPYPDIVIRSRASGRTLGVFDTKYKDLWENKVPREILYQMSIYALAWSESDGRSVPSVVLYPRPKDECRDIEYRLDVHDGQARRILLRGVDWAAAIRAVERGDGDAGRKLTRAWASTEIR